MGLSGHASGEAVVAVVIAFTAIAGTVIIARLLTRIVIVKHAGLDDAFIVCSLIFTIATAITMCLQVRWGTGRHMDTLSQQDGIHNEIAFYLSVPFYNLAISCTKFSIMLQYLRIFPYRMFVITSYTLMAIVGLYTCWTFFSSIFACWPIAYFWNPAAHPGGHCLNRFSVWFANAGINIVTDIAIAILPLPVLRNLELPQKQRVVLMVVFGLGAFTCVVSILRLQSLYIISKATDVTWENPMAAIWSIVEINTGILCSSIPTLKALITLLFPRILSTVRTRPGVGSAQRHASYGNNSMSQGILSPNRSKSFAGRKNTTLNSKSSSSDEGKSRFFVRTQAMGTSDDIEFANLRSNAATNQEVEDGQIQVVTVVEQDFQDVEKLGRYCEDHEGRRDRDLVRPPFLDDDSGRSD